MTPDMLKLENQLCHRLYSVSNAITRAYRPYLQELGLTYPQYVVMMALWEKDGIAIQDLIQKTKMDGGSLTQVLGKIQSLEFIHIQADRTDRRKKIIHLSEKGKQLQDRALSVPEQMACKFSAIPMADFQVLMRLLDKMSCELS